MSSPNWLPDSKSWGLEKAEKIEQGVEDVESPIEGVVVDWAGDAKPVAEGIKMESRQVEWWEMAHAGFNMTYSYLTSKTMMEVEISARSFHVHGLDA